MKPRRRLRVGERDERGLQRAPEEERRALEHEEERVDLGRDVGRALEDALAPAEHAVEAPVLAPAGVGRGQERRAEAIAVELVPRVGHRRETEEARVERLLEPALHLGELLVVGLDGLSTARPRPSTRVRRSECPRNVATFGPIGCSRKNSTYSRGVDHVFFSRRAGARASAAPTRRA